MSDAPESLRPLLTVTDLAVEFRSEGRVTPAVKNVSFQIDRGRTLGLVGESGSGKSVSSLAIMGLVPNPPGRVTQGRIEFEGTDLRSLDQAGLRRIRGNDIAMIFQEPMTALNPVFTVGSQIVEAVRLHQGLDRDAARARAIEMLELVGIPSPAERVDDYPHQMSGGMRQRVMIALAMSCDPRILIADEPTTALDVTVQAQILKLMKDLQAQLGMAIMFITHDLAVIARMADEVAVMYLGQIVEYGPVRAIFNNPSHPYTVALLQAVPKLGAAGRKKLAAIEGTVPLPINLPKIFPT